MTVVKIEKTNPRADYVHTKGRLLLYPLLSHPINLYPGSSLVIETGVQAHIPEGCVGLLHAKSDTTWDSSTRVLAQGARVLQVVVRVVGQQIAYIHPGEPIAELTIVAAPAVRYTEEDS